MVVVFVGDCGVAPAVMMVPAAASVAAIPAAVVVDDVLEAISAEELPAERGLTAGATTGGEADAAAASRVAWVEV